VQEATTIRLHVLQGQRASPFIARGKLDAVRAT
jgi:hypothetical protein